MEISASHTADQALEVQQALLLKKAIKAEQAQQLALIESARSTSPQQPLDNRLIGRLLNEKV